MWVGADVTRPIRVRRTVMSKKHMFWIVFSRTGIGAAVTLPVGQSFNKDFFACTMLPSIVDDRALSCPELKTSCPFAHLDNARSRLTSDQYDKFGINRLPHPPYSPDLAPCYFWLFRYLKHSLEGRFFADDIALEGAVSKILISIEPDMFVRVFAEWKHRLQQCINQGGDYLGTGRLASPFIKLSRTCPRANRVSAPPVHEGIKNTLSHRGIEQSGH
jgi:histone-lysine N-methyltransferase SETMAR